MLVAYTANRHPCNRSSLLSATDLDHREDTAAGSPGFIRIHLVFIRGSPLLHPPRSLVYYACAPVSISRLSLQRAATFVVFQPSPVRPSSPRAKHVDHLRLHTVIRVPAFARIPVLGLLTRQAPFRSATAPLLILIPPIPLRPLVTRQSCVQHSILDSCWSHAHVARFPSIPSSTIEHKITTNHHPP